MKKDRLLKSTSLLAFLIISFACNNDPKVIGAKNEEANKETRDKSKGPLWGNKKMNTKCKIKTAAEVRRISF